MRRWWWCGWWEQKKASKENNMEWSVLFLFKLLLFTNCLNVRHCRSTSNELIVACFIFILLSLGLESFNTRKEEAKKKQLSSNAHKNQSQQQKVITKIFVLVAVVVTGDATITRCVLLLIFILFHRRITKPWRKMIPITQCVPYNLQMCLEIISKHCTFSILSRGRSVSTWMLHTLWGLTHARTCTPFNCRFYPNALCNFPC